MISSSNLEVLSTNTNDKLRWKNLIDQLPDDQKDVYLLPEYAALYEKYIGEPTYLLNFDSELGAVIMVIAIRTLDDLPFYNSKKNSIDRRYSDITSPYGYGGPVIRANPGCLQGQLFSDFRTELHNFCLDRSIVAEFLRLNPINGNHRLFGQSGGLREKNRTIWMDLRKGEFDIWNDMKSNRRSRIKQSRQYGVEVVHSDLRSDHIKEFHDLYIKSMERLNALPMYFFPLEFFEDLVSEMGEQIALFFGVWRGKKISGQWFLHWGNYVDYYLSGSDVDDWNLHGNTLGIYSAALWAKEKGYQYLHLGGGHGCENDNLLEFKSQFSKNYSPYYMYQEIHDQQTYSNLCEMKRNFDNNGQHRSVLDPVLVDYFPEYRA